MMTTFKSIKRYLYIYWLFFKNSFMSEMEYRANFFFGCVIELAYLCIKLLYVLVIYRVGIPINGLSPDAILMCIGSFTFMTGIYCLFFYANFMELPQHIRNGTLDMMITKPISLQFMSTMRRSIFGFSVTNLLSGVIMIWIGWHRIQIPLTPKHILGYVALTLCAIAITYTIFLIPSLLSFWTVQAGGLNEMSTMIWEMNHMPMNIYSRSIQNIGTFLYPVFLITNLAPFFVLGQLQTSYLVWGIVSPIVFLILSRMLWNKAVKNYTSASS
jgi:ABC-2 type transport system permease protein